MLLTLSAPTRPDDTPWHAVASIGRGRPEIFVPGCIPTNLTYSKSIIFDWEARVKNIKYACASSQKAGSIRFAISLPVPFWN